MTFNRPPPSLPPGYLKDGYFDKNGDILPELIIEWPKALANAFRSSIPPLSTAQLRKFFQEVVHQEGRLTSGIPFTALKTDVLKLDSYAQNALKKKNAPLLFRSFVEQNIRFAAKDEKSLKAFKTHFECIVGYYPETK